MQSNLYQLGFVFEPAAIHNKRTISIPDVELLFQLTTPALTYGKIRELVVEDNILAKHTHSARQGILRSLREFYGLDPNLVLYSSLRFFWQYADYDRPLLALLCAAARDPILQQSSNIILPWPKNTPLPKTTLEKYLQGKHLQIYSPNVQARMVRNIMASWKQAGHLTGYRSKIRTQAMPGPASTAYAFIGLPERLREIARLNPSGSTFDASTAQIHNYAFAAAKRGWLDKHGGIVDISFPYPYNRE